MASNPTALAERTPDCFFRAFLQDLLSKPLNFLARLVIPRAYDAKGACRRRQRCPFTHHSSAHARSLFDVTANLPHAVIL